ncbi:hypothetical protein QYE76_050838 [Lolium multiflorum]|uniref:Transposase-associated domain-containing protein n=1 Tax=Lolium multiflorum TaxID=4521 RepID=A0AAD8WHP2_LOLMU|nr:hypothetical protein QYE76_050838 [Lolium multiflorum]
MCGATRVEEATSRAMGSSGRHAISKVARYRHSTRADEGVVVPAVFLEELVNKDHSSISARDNKFEFPLRFDDIKYAALNGRLGFKITRMHWHLMSHPWMYGNRCAPAFREGVNSFLLVAEANKSKQGFMCCPCLKCKNEKDYSCSRDIKSHLLRFGFMSSYNVWTKHGEEGVMMEDGDEEEDNDDQYRSMFSECFDTAMDDNEEEGGEEQASDDPVDDDLRRAISDARRDCGTDKERLQFDKMLEDHHKLLYPGCEDGHRKLGSILELLKWKAEVGVTDSGFEKLMIILKKLFPRNNELPVSTYEAKKLVCPLGLDVQKIHACINDCILYRGEKYENLNKCPICGALRYKIRKDDPGDVEGEPPRKRVPAKVMWYAPIIPRLKRLFRNKEHAQLLRWHMEERKKDAMLRHPADGRQWRNIGREFPDFAAPEPYTEKQIAYATSFLNTPSQYDLHEKKDDYTRHLARVIDDKRENIAEKKAKKKDIATTSKSSARSATEKKSSSTTAPLKAKETTKGKKRKEVPLLGDQPKQSIPALKVFNVPKLYQQQGGFDMEEAAKLAAACDVTVEELMAAADIVPTADIVPQFVYGADLVSKEQLHKLPTHMRNLHQWYLDACKENIRFIVAHIPREYYYRKEEIHIEINELWQLFNLDALDKSLMSCYCLLKISECKSHNIINIGFVDPDKVNVQTVKYNKEETGGNLLSFHWILLDIKVDKGIVEVRDPLSRGVDGFRDLQKLLQV